MPPTPRLEWSAGAAESPPRVRGPPIHTHLPPLPTQPRPSDEPGTPSKLSGGGAAADSPRAAAARAPLTTRANVLRVLVLLLAAALLSGLAAQSLGGGGDGGGGSSLGRRGGGDVGATARPGAPTAPAAAHHTTTAHGLAALCAPVPGAAHDLAASGRPRGAGPPAPPGGAGGRLAVVAGSPLAVPCAAPSPGAPSLGAAIGQPTVALMFLTASDLPHAGTWSAWLRAAGGLVRADCLAASVCAAPAVGGSGAAVTASTTTTAAPAAGGRRLAGADADAAAALAALSADVTADAAAARPSDPIAAQTLFTVYVHTPPNVTLKEGTPFAGREVSARVAAAWGDHSIVEATRAMLRAALKDPRNQRFVLLSEADAPLYSAAATYAQLMGEKTSRVDACVDPAKDRALSRFTPRMETEHFKEAHWRKSSQWVTLTRRAAAAIGADEEIAASFKANCVNGWDDDRQDNRWCHSDEHYIPSALAALGLANETDCVGGAMAVDWSGGGAHPATYWHHDISGDLIERQRASDDACEPSAAFDAAAPLFVRLEQVAPAAPRECAWTPRPLTPPAPGVPTRVPVLTPRCTLFARKFVREVAERLLGLAEGDDGLRLLDRAQPTCPAGAAASGGLQ